MCVFTIFFTVIIYSKSNNYSSSKYYPRCAGKDISDVAYDKSVSLFVDKFAGTTISDL